MKRYFRHVVFFVVLALFLVGSYYVNSYVIKKSKSYLPDTTSILITGSSLFSNGINPKYIDGSENVSLAAEPLCVSYWKIKSICDIHPSIRTVVVSFSLPELSLRKDDDFNGKRDITSELLERISYLDYGFKLQNLDAFELDYFRYWEVFFRNRVFPNYQLISNLALGGKRKFVAPYLGEYNGSRGDSHKLEELIDFDLWKTRYFPTVDEKAQISRIDNFYLDSIYNYCHANDLSLFVVSMPVRPNFYKMIPQGFIDYQKGVLDYYRKKENVHVLEFDLFSPAEMFYDQVHLNGNGARKLSTSIAAYIDSAFVARPIEREMVTPEHL